jgi:hypothetical protein
MTGLASPSNISVWVESAGKMLLNVNEWLSLALDNLVLETCSSIVLSESTR